MLSVIVDAEGHARDIHVAKSLGMGLDEKAIEAVRQYRFRPAMYEGHSVAVQLLIDVDFHLH
jgi:TonB family protein